MFMDVLLPIEEINLFTHLQDLHIGFVWKYDMKNQVEHLLLPKMAIIWDNMG